MVLFQDLWDDRDSITTAYFLQIRYISFSLLLSHRIQPFHQRFVYSVNANPIEPMKSMQLSVFNARIAVISVENTCKNSSYNLPFTCIFSPSKR
jgi:hypothetical protein